MRWYLQIVEDYARRGVATVSSHHLARAAHVRSSLVRRDLSALGRFGVPGRGYEVELLLRAMRRRLRLGRARAAVWLGGTEMADGEEARAALGDVHCRLVGVFDDRHRDKRVAGQVVHPLAQAPDWVRRRRASVAVLASEEAARPELVEELVAAGIRAVLNLTSVPLGSCAQAVIEQGDLRSQLSRLLCRLPAEAGLGGRGA